MTAAMAANCFDQPIATIDRVLFQDNEKTKDTPQMTTTTNPADEPYLTFHCDHCGKVCQEQKAFGVNRDDSLLFCSADCVQSFEESMRPEA